MPAPTFLLGGQTLTKAQVLAPLQGFVDATAKTTAAWHTSLPTRVSPFLPGCQATGFSCQP